MKHCPSSLAGATTGIAPTSTGVDLVVTSPDPAVAREILARATAATGSVNAGGAPHHDGTHSGPGTIGFCPVVRVNTAITVDPISNGARIHIAPLDPRELTALQVSVQERVDALARPNS